ncbi:MAG: proline--tRNA ligase [Bdellovibrionales bacterium]|nr:proline--tRNA ligase [Bdellovibrionales bacterium]
MKWSETGLKTLREVPADTALPSHALLTRGGFIKKLTAGIFTYGPFMVRAIHKFENIVREELNKKNCVEILMPMVQPTELWIQSGRLNIYGELLQKMKNRTGQEFCLGPTHEEVISNYVKNNINSYRDLPFCLYQIQNKFRDEIRPRFGLMRAREFLMKDAYSFDLNEEQAKESYKKMESVYQAIFSRLNIPFRTVKADSGEIGGDLSEEFHILAEHGEDELLFTDSFAANREVCPVYFSQEPTSAFPPHKEKKPEEFSTSGIKTIEQLSRFLSISTDQLVKIIFLSCRIDSDSTQNIAFLLRGSDELNLYKVKKHLKLKEAPLFLTAQEVKKLSGVDPGSCGPIGLSIPIYMDQELKTLSYFVTGANKDHYHIKNVVPERDFKVSGIGDFRYAKPGDKGPDNQVLRSCRGIEVGHIFYLGDKYSKKMNIYYLDQKGNKQPVKMGCYGIGITRTIQAVVEHSHDKNGIIWPKSIAPFLVHICLLNPQDQKTREVANQLYQSLWKKGIDTFLDDRDEKPGVKFKDADLLGFPLRINIGARDRIKGLVELIIRPTGKREKVPTSSTLEKVLSCV